MQKVYQLWLRLHSPYIVRIPQVLVLSVEYEDKRDLISRGAIFTDIRQDPLPSKVVQIIRETHLRNLMYSVVMARWDIFYGFICKIQQVVKETAKFTTTKTKLPFSNTPRLSRSALLILAS